MYSSSSNPINITTTAPSPASSAVPQSSHETHPRIFSGSAALGGTQLSANEENISSGSQGYGSLLQPVRSPANNTIAPRAPSPAVGTIGGHRSPALGASQNASNSSTTLPRPMSLFELGGRDETLFAGFAGGMSPSAQPPSHSPFALGLHRPASAVESAFYERDKIPQVNRTFTMSPPMPDQSAHASSSSSPARPGDRPTSRLDFGKLQQRSNAAAAAAAAQSTSQDPSRPNNIRQHSSNERLQGSSSFTRTPNLVSTQSRPELVRPRAEVAIQRSLSGEGEGGVNLATLTLDQSDLGLNPSGTAPGMMNWIGAGHSSPLDAAGQGGYPFPGPQHQQVGTPNQGQPSRYVMDRLSNRSHGSQRSPAPLRIASPLDPNRHRFSSPVPFNLIDHNLGGPSNQPQFVSADSSGAHQNGPNTSRKHRGMSSSPDHDSSRRLVALESAMAQVTKALTNLASDVGWLMEREKLKGGALPRQEGTSDDWSKEDEIRGLKEQIELLSGNVKQLLAVKQQEPRRGPSSQLNLTGLGLSGGGERGGSLRPRGSGAGSTSPQFPPMGSGGASSAPSSDQNIPRSPFGLPNVPMVSRGLSPRPGGNGRGQQQQQTWSTSPNVEGRVPPQNALQRSTQHGGSHAGAGVPSSNSSHANSSAPGHQESAHPASVDLSSSPLIVSKWEHLPLQPDLLRSVLKYGLGPPNKVQQRALPFLLRGSDVIAQAPPTQERIASYVIPALHAVLTTLRCPPLTGSPSANSTGPFVLIVTTTVDQATQAQRMAVGLGGSLGVRVHIAAAVGVDIETEVRNIVQSRPHIIVGTPTKMSDVVARLADLRRNSIGSDQMGGSTSIPDLGEARMIILDEVDQMIARNLSHHAGTMLRALPTPTWADGSPGGPSSPLISPSMATAGNNPFDSQASRGGGTTVSIQVSNQGERQTAIFSNTVPQDVLTFAQSIQLRESVRVLVRREGTTVTQHPPAGSAMGGANSTSNTGGGLPINQGGGTFRSASPAVSGSGADGFGKISGGGYPSMTSSTFQAPGTQSQAGSNHTGLTSQDRRPPVPRQVSGPTDTSLTSLRAMRHYYLYVAVPDLVNTSRSGGGDMKSDLISDILEDVDFHQVIVYTSSTHSMEALMYKMSSRGIETICISRADSPSNRAASLSKFRSAGSSLPRARGQQGGTGAANGVGTSVRKALIVCETTIYPSEVHQIPLVVFFDVPRTLDEYRSKVAVAFGNGNGARGGVCVNIVSAAPGGGGGPSGVEVEVLRGLEGILGVGIRELPGDVKGLLNG